MGEILRTERLAEIANATGGPISVSSAFSLFFAHDAALRAALLASEKAREEAEERLTLKRREYDIEVEVHAATKRERDSYIKGYEAAESRAARLAHAGAEFASQYGASAFDCRYDNSCDDSGREPRCEPCELRAAIAAEEGK